MVVVSVLSMFFSIMITKLGNDGAMVPLDGNNLVVAPIYAA